MIVGVMILEEKDIVRAGDIRWSLSALAWIPVEERLIGQPWDIGGGPVLRRPPPKHNVEESRP